MMFHYHDREESKLLSKSDDFATSLNQALFPSYGG